MLPETIFKNENIYFAQETIGGISCTVGYIKKFRWRWFATQLNTFIIIGATENTIDKKTIENFSTACFNYAINNNKGWPRGIQAAVGSIAILQGNTMNEDAIQFCEKLSKKHWSAFEIPVLYNSEQKKYIRFKSYPVWGIMYFPYFEKTIDYFAEKLKS